MVVGLDQDDVDPLAATACGASFTAQASAEDVQQLKAKVVASVRSDLLEQQLDSKRPEAAATVAASVPVVEVDVACRVMAAALSSLESRLARYHALEQRLTAAGDMEHVELNVGGERFHTTVATLCKEPSYLQGMFSGYVFEFLCVPRTRIP
jgi:hypothetical protein